MQLHYFVICLDIIKSLYSMKQHILVLGILLVASYCSGQKADIDNHRIYVEYASLPENFVFPEDRSYYVDVSTGSYKFDKDDLSNQITIRGWERTESGKVGIKLSATDFVRGKSSYKKRVAEKKDKDGKVISKTNYYRYEVTNTGRANLKIYGPVNKFSDKEPSKKEQKKEDEKNSNPFLKDVAIDNSEEVFEDLARNHDLSKTYNYQTSEFKTIKEASDEYNRNSSREYADQLEEFTSTLASRATHELNRFYGYNRNRDWAKFKRLDSKKHPEFEMYDNAIKALKEIFSQKRFNKAHTDIKNSVTPIIDYFESILTNYGANDKHQKRLKAASMYNLAQIYYYLDEPDKVIAIGNQYLNWGHDKKDGERFIKKAKSLKEQLMFHDMAGRYFETNENADDIDLEDVTVDDEN